MQNIRHTPADDSIITRIYNEKMSIVGVNPIIDILFILM